jgi:hypothetical protein
MLDGPRVPILVRCVSCSCVHLSQWRRGDGSSSSVERRKWLFASTTPASLVPFKFQSRKTFVPPFAAYDALPRAFIDRGCTVGCRAQLLRQGQLSCQARPCFPRAPSAGGPYPSDHDTLGTFGTACVHICCMETHEMRARGWKRASHSNSHNGCRTCR